MTTHKYKLQKYTGAASRLQCPKCEHKRVFAIYLDIDTNEPLNSDVGRCNREDKCGYHYTPSQYFKDNPTNTGNKPYTSSLQYKQKPTTPKVYQVINTIPKEYIIKSIGYNSNFIQFLCTLFDRATIESPTIERIMNDYYLGRTKDKGVIFWQIDTNKRIRTGKVMYYNTDTGKRIKSDKGGIDWVHSKLKRNNTLPTEWELTQCFFGEHLLNKRPNDNVCIVESEKSAIIASGVMPESIWLATGGKQNLRADKCQILKGRNVTLFPDLGAFKEWSDKAKKIMDEVVCSIRVSTILENKANDTDRYNGLDIADYLIREIMQEKPLKVIPKTFTEEERALQSLIEINPNMIPFINTLGLFSITTKQPFNISV